MTLRIYSNVHATINSIFRRTYWSRFLQALLRYILQHLDLYFLFPGYLVLIIISSTRRLSLLLLMKLWRSRPILKGLRLLEPVIPSTLRLCEESLQLVPLSVTFLFWIDLCTTGLLFFRLLLSSTLISMRRSLLYFHHRSFSYERDPLLYLYKLNTQY